jgi:hypothetical protein
MYVGVYGVCRRSIDKLTVHDEWVAGRPILFAGLVKHDYEYVDIYLDHVLRYPKNY